MSTSQVARPQVARNKEGEWWEERQSLAVAWDANARQHSNSCFLSRDWSWTSRRVPSRRSWLRWDGLWMDPLGVSNFSL
jgi:hypothetical protein